MVSSRNRGSVLSHLNDTTPDREERFASDKARSAFAKSQSDRAAKRKAQIEVPPAANDDTILHGDLAKRNLGTRINAAALVGRILGEQEIERQTNVIANKLKVAGVDTERSDDVTIIGALSGVIFNEARYRNINILPAVAKRKRAKLLTEFSYWSQTYTYGKFLRYLVITSGRTVPLDELPERFESFSRKIGDFVEGARIGFDCHVHLAAIETTFDRHDDGQVYVNLHVNLAYDPRTVLKRQPWIGSDGKQKIDAADGTKLTKWDDWLDYGRRFFETEQTRDAGLIEDAAELIKYVAKPADMLTLNAEETAALARLLHRRQLIRTYGDLGEWLRDLKDRRLKIARDDDTGHLVMVRMKTREQEQADEAMADAKREQDAKKAKNDGPPRKAENEIVFVTLPQARRSLIKEPMIGVRGYVAEPTTASGHKGLLNMADVRATAVNRLRTRLRDEYPEMPEEWSPDEVIRSASMLDTSTLIPLALSDLEGLGPRRAQGLIAKVGLKNVTVEAVLDDPGRFTGLLRAKLKPTVDDAPRHAFLPLAKIPVCDPDAPRPPPETSEIPERESFSSARDGVVVDKVELDAVGREWKWTMEQDEKGRWARVGRLTEAVAAMGFRLTDAQLADSARLDALVEGAMAGVRRVDLESTPLFDPALADKLTG